MILTQWHFVVASAIGWMLVVGLALRFRTRAYAGFRGVLLPLHTLVVVGMFGYWHDVEPLLLWPYAYLHACVFLQSLGLVWPRMRSPLYRLLVSWPDAYFQAATMLAIPWALARALGYPLPLFWLPYLLAALGLWQVTKARVEEVDLVVADAGRAGSVARHPFGELRVARPLRVVQITDPHLGTFMSVSRLREICRRAVAHAPDLVLLTGDFLTMNSQSDRSLLADALAPLKALPGRVFGCLGNHDLEAPATVRHAFAAIDATLLVDDAALVETAAGSVQLLGADFRWRDNAKHLTALCQAHPRRSGALRLLMLHDPGAFKHLPEGEADLVFSGHTHGGQIGLLSLGFSGTILSAFSSVPDHGFFARGRDRLYVHRGTGHYGFPLRLGVPAEESLLRVHWVARGAE